MDCKFELAWMAFDDIDLNTLWPGFNVREVDRKMVPNLVSKISKKNIESTLK